MHVDHMYIFYNEVSVHTVCSFLIKFFIVDFLYILDMLVIIYVLYKHRWSIPSLKLWNPEHLRGQIDRLGMFKW